MIDIISQEFYSTLAGDSGEIAVLRDRIAEEEEGEVRRRWSGDADACARAAVCKRTGGK